MAARAAQALDDTTNNIETLTKLIWQNIPFEKSTLNGSIEYDILQEPIASITTKKIYSNGGLLVTNTRTWKKMGSF